MIGQIVGDSGPFLVLNDAGRWEPPADVEDELRPLLESQCRIFNAIHNPAEPEAGDHHMPYGAGSLMRASQSAGMKYELSKPSQPLPEGAIS